MNGERVHCARFGAGPPVVLLHGIQGTSDSWAEVAELLAIDYTVFAPDLRGRVPSPVPAGRGSYSLDRFADDLGTVIDAIGQPVTLIAWSMGVMVTLQYLAEGRPPPQSLVLVSGSAHLGRSGSWFRGTAFNDVQKEAADRAQKLGLRESATPYAVAASWEHVQRADFRHILPSITVPTLIMHGGRDDQCSINHGRFLAAGLHNAELEVWEDAGHNLMTYDKQLFVDSARRFMTGRAVLSSSGR